MSPSGFASDPAPGEMAVLGRTRPRRRDRYRRAGGRSRREHRGRVAGRGRLEAVTTWSTPTGTSTGLEDAHRGRPQHVRVQRARVPRLHPRRRSVHGGARGVPGASAQSVRRLVAAEPGGRPDRRERDPLDVLALRLPAPSVAGLLTTGGSLANLSAFVTGATREAGRGLPRRHVLRAPTRRMRATRRRRRSPGSPRRNLRLVPTDRELRMDPDALRRWSAKTARRAAVRSWRSRPSARRTPARSIPSATSPTSRRPRRCGCTSTRPTAASSSSPIGAGSGSEGSSGPTASRWIRTRDSSCPTGRAVWSCGTAPRSATRTTRAPPTSRTLPPTGDAAELQRVLARALAGQPRVPGVVPAGLHGVAAFREALDEKLDLTDRLHRALVADPTWRSVDPQLTVVPFRLRAADDGSNRRVAGADQRVQARVPVEHHDPDEYWSVPASCRTARTPDRWTSVPRSCKRRPPD